MLLTFYERFTFSLGNSGKWLLSIVRPAPQTWHRRPGMIARLAGCHVQRCANGRGGFGWSLLEAPPKRAAYEEDERSVFFLLSQLAITGCGSDSFESQLAIAGCSSDSFESRLVIAGCGSDNFESDGISSNQTVTLSVPVRWLLRQFQSDGW